MLFKPSQLTKFDYHVISENISIVLTRYLVYFPQRMHCTPAKVQSSVSLPVASSYNVVAASVSASASFISLLTLANR